MTLTPFSTRTVVGTSTIESAQRKKNLRLFDYIPIIL